MGAVCVGPQIVHRLLPHAGRTSVSGIDAVVQPLLGDFVPGRSGNINNRGNTFSHRVSEVVQGVVPLVAKQVAGFEVRVQLQHGIQVRPQTGPLNPVGWSDGAGMEVERAAGLAELTGVA